MKIHYETDLDIWFQSEGAWEVNLDQRKLKTPLGNPLKVSITLDGKSSQSLVDAIIQ